MILEETFTVPQPREQVWTYFLSEVERVARCVPGLGEFEDLGGDKYRVTLSQKIGHLGATFDLKAALVSTEPQDRLVFTATGRSVRGVRGDMFATNRVELAAAGEAATTVTVTCDLALGGMVGSIGHRAVTAKAKEVVREFAATVSAEIGRWAAR